MYNLFPTIPSLEGKSVADLRKVSSGLSLKALLLENMRFLGFPMFSLKYFSIQGVFL